MLQMVYERETMWQIRSEVDKYDKYHQLGGDSVVGLSDTAGPRVSLCSEVSQSLTISAYGSILFEDFGIEDFVTPLCDLLQGRINPNSTFNKVGYQFHFPPTILIQQVITYSSCRVSYLCQETGGQQKEILHVALMWQNKGPRYDSVIIQGHLGSSFFFAEVHGLFSVCVDGTTFGVAIVKPFARRPRNKTTGYIELDEGQNPEFCFVESIIRTVHIIPPTPHNHRFVVQDLTDGDIYLRLFHLK